MKIFFTSDLHGEEALYRQILDNGPRSGGGDSYPGRRSPSFFAENPPLRRDDREQRSFIDAFLLPFFRKGLETRFRRILLIPGNWDPAYPEIFATPPEGLVDLDRKRFRLENGYEFIGYPFVPPTPFRPKDYEKMDDPIRPGLPKETRPTSARPVRPSS